MHKLRLVELVGSIENDEIDHTVEDFEVDVNLHTLTTHSIIYDSPRTSSLRLVISLFVILIQIFAVTQLTLDLFILNVVFIIIVQVELIVGSVIKL